MTGASIVGQLPLFTPEALPPRKADNKPNLHAHWLHRDRLPVCAQRCPTLLRHLDLIGPRIGCTSPTVMSTSTVATRCMSAASSSLLWVARPGCR